MHIVVCINRIPDPEAPPKQFRLDEASNRPVLDRMSWLIGPFDENALETALQLKDSAGARITALTVGPVSNQEALRRALALRCDAAVHVKEDRAVGLDSAGVARTLAAAIRKLGEVNMVLCGQQVGDWDSGQVGQLLAEELSFAYVNLLRQIEPNGGAVLRINTEVAAGFALVEARLPIVATVTNANTNQLRIPKVKDVMIARRATITVWTAADLGLDMAELLGSGATVAVRRLFTPDTGGQVEMIRGENDEEVAERLARRILDLKVV
jgi:electron transfer flavoprotein beta subunit